MLALLRLLAYLDSFVLCLLHHPTYLEPFYYNVVCLVAFEHFDLNDSIADIIFVVCCAAQLLQMVEIPVWLWTWAGVIAFIKIVNQISALVVCKRFCFPHTWANKLTGILLFLAFPVVFWTVIPIAIVAVIATFAAAQEGHFIRTKQANCF